MISDERELGSVSTNIRTVVFLPMIFMDLTSERDNAWVDVVARFLLVDGSVGLPGVAVAVGMLPKYALAWYMKLSRWIISLLGIEICALLL